MKSRTQRNREYYERCKADGWGVYHVIAPGPATQALREYFKVWQAANIHLWRNPAKTTARKVM